MHKKWLMCKLDEICDIFTGNSINEKEKIEKYTDISDGYNYIGTKDIGFDQCIDYENGIKIPTNDLKFKIAPKGSVLLCIEGGSAGRKIGLTDQDVCFGNKLCAFVSKINNRYIFYFLQTSDFRNIFSYNKNGLIGGVSVNKLKDIKIPIPPLAEQGRIVAKIEELFAGIDAGVENLKSVKNQIALYRQSVLKSAFDGTLYKTTEWNFTSIGTVCDINPKTVLPDFSDDSIVSFLPMPTVEAETGAFSPETVEYKKVKKGYTKFQNNDVLFAKITPCMENGKSCVVRDLIQGVGFGSTEFHVLRCHAGMLPEYVFYFVVQKVFRSKAIPFMTGAVGQKRVPADYLRDCEIPVPTLAEQEKIVAEIESHFERADALETAVDRALNDAEKLKQAVLKKAFSGELVPQNPDDEPASVLLDRIRAARASEQRANPKKGKQKR